DIFGVQPAVAEFLADDSMLGEELLDQAPHRVLRRVIGFRHRVEASAGRFVVRRQHRAKKGKDRLAGDVCELLDEFLELDRRHAPPRRLIVMSDKSPAGGTPAMARTWRRSD